MSDVLLIYITCESDEQAKKIGTELLKLKLCACIKVITDTYGAYFWPPKSGKITESHEAVLLIKTIESKFPEIEKQVRALHTDQTPCILGIPVKFVNSDYYDWMKGEMEK